MAFRLEFQNVLANAVLACALTLFAAAAIYSIRVREKLMALQNAARFVHDVNHEYRNVLSEALGPHEDLQQTDPIDPELVKREREIIETVCHRIAAIYTALISRPCTVTVKVLTKEGSDWFCHTYARSEPRSRRDRDGGPDAYAVGTGENTAFDIASQPAPVGISHFFCPDLPKLKKSNQYRNRRDNFEKYYKSAIVVPIRFHPRPKQQGIANDRGFLCVDTPSTHCLNAGFHLELLAAFADQMYNFFSLMRGTYRLPTTPIRKDATT